MGGDFNVLLNINLDRYGGNPRHDEKVMRKINDFMNDFDVVDIWRISNNMQNFITDTGIKPALSTDHSRIYLNIENVFINNKRGFRTGNFITLCVMILGIQMLFMTRLLIGSELTIILKTIECYEN